MTALERMELLDKACELLGTADQLISSRMDGDGSKKCLIINLPFVYGMYFGVLGAKKLIDGEPVGNTELDFVNTMAANYAVVLDSLGVVPFEPYEQAMARLEAEGISFNDPFAKGDDAS